MANNYNSILQGNNTDLQAILNKINDLPSASGGSIDLPTLTNEGSASDLLSGKEFINSDGAKIQGTMPNNGSVTSTMDGINTKSITIPTGYTSGGTVSLDDTIDNEVEEQADIISQIMSVANNLPDAGSGGENTDVEDSLVTGNITTYTNNRVTSIRKYAFESCSSLTLVSFSAATTIGSYAFQHCYNLTSVSFPAAITIGDYAFYLCQSLTTADFSAVTAIGRSAFTDCNSLRSANFPTATDIGNGAFNGCATLTSVSFPVATTINSFTFNQCQNLITANFPLVTDIGSYAFNNCNSLTSVSFPVALIIGTNAFGFCDDLISISFPKVITINSFAFHDCSKLTSLYLTASKVCNLEASTAFNSTLITSTTGSIFVRTPLINSYKTATNWAYFANRIFGTDDYEDEEAEVITFTINGTECEAIEGMTWAEWVDTEYNTLGIMVNDNYVYQLKELGGAAREMPLRHGAPSFTTVKPFDAIIAGYSYSSSMML